MIYPGATLGVLGGGQLGRMFTMAAHSMGYRVCVLDPDKESPAGTIAEHHLQSNYTDESALLEMTRICSAVTTEFENVPASTLEFLEKSIPVRPSAKAVSIARDRILEKTFIRENGLPTAEFIPVYTEADCISACNDIPLPALLKTTQLGYDGKGQRTVNNINDAVDGFKINGGVPCVLEQKIQLNKEISVILARNEKGEIAAYPIGENKHENGILSTTVVPAHIDQKTEKQAISMATCLAEALHYCGVLAVEFFIATDGNLLINEIAPRPHNSGHYTLDACVTDQFEQQVRMLCNLPPASTQLLSPAVMLNLLGDIWPNKGEPQWIAIYQNKRAKLHLYGKNDARQGRKMGHINLLARDTATALSEAERLQSELGIKN
ncbi:MAG: 5-(carboxyamino)imidazole ribonucleotide synthase [Gammaproteobacteria bacterium]